MSVENEERRKPRAEGQGDLFRIKQRMDCGKKYWLAYLEFMKWMNARGEEDPEIEDLGKDRDNFHIEPRIFPRQTSFDFHFD